MTVTCDEPARIRIMPVPRTDPPYDDELELAPPIAVTTGGVQGALALAFTLPGGLPTLPSPPVPLVQLRAVPDDISQFAEEPDDPAVRPQLTTRANLPDPHRFAGRLAQAILEVVSGARPAAQLARWTSKPVYDDISRRLSRLASSGAPGLRGVVAGCVRSVHVTEPLDGIAEVCAIVQREGRALAVALRLEGLDGRWMCTELTFI